MPKQSYTCGHCGRVFEDYATNRTKGDTLYCSRHCKGQAQTAKAVAAASIKTESRCATCGKVKPVGDFYADKKCRANGSIQYDCKECVKDKRRAYYDAHVEEVNQRVTAHRRAHPGRKSQVANNPAHRKLNTAVETGRVIKAQACEQCGKAGHLHGHHHRGYEHPLDVVWLCPSCHHAAHGRGPKAR